MTGKREPDPVDSFTPQEHDMTNVQEDSGQQSCSTKELDKSGEVDIAQKSRSTKELDELGEGENDKDERKKLVKEEVPKRETW